MRAILMFGVGLLAASHIGVAAAQDRDGKTIQVTGIGSVETPPDVAGMSYVVRGEGSTSDDAVRAMNAKKAAIEQAIGGGGVKVTTGNMQIGELRGANCPQGYDRMPQLSEGNCAVRGYSAQMQVTARIRPVTMAGTLTGVAAKAGASNPVLTGFSLSNPEAARQRALEAAVIDGQAQAAAIARATGVKLGPLVKVTDPNPGVRYGMTDTASYASRPRVEDVVEVPMSPAAVNTNVGLVLVYQLER